MFHSRSFQNHLSLTAYRVAALEVHLDRDSADHRLCFPLALLSACRFGLRTSSQLAGMLFIGYEAAKIIAERIVENRLERKGGGTSIRQISENPFICVGKERVAVFTPRFNAQRSRLTRYVELHNAGEPNLKRHGYGVVFVNTTSQRSRNLSWFLLSVTSPIN